tara:strand:+ start:139 stop:315 length:177 start_codon:yes stop_codon:yes gene_type:complete
MTLLYKLSNEKNGKNEKLDEWGYPIHPEYNFEKPEGDFETRIVLVIVFSLIIIGIILI